ncbi:FAD-dependent oxidoreductase [Mesorhizobium sp. B263B1A]|uniref:FAD-dependent oxidoreductase n=1 Tax=Mesorhizobium sp. B263B1A TaxID=2876670 RepID=UPI001CD06FF2|nr:FAD-dependent oxidoreductase [Mesorhizobium sp. B263B1A]MCA0025724.1 FAD-dependent oxidoreductase [Mesorhizobium sp. B263B1A]
MRLSLDELSGSVFDVAIVGAGINGAETARCLSAAGYSVLLVDKSDFAAGASGRSSRLLHCGLRYLAPGKSVWEFVRQPQRFLTACRMARAAMQSRAQFVRDTPDRIRSMRFCFPVYRGGPYSGWQIDAAFRILKSLGGREVPLNYRRLSGAEVGQMPLLQHLRDKQALQSVAMFDEYQFDWPERVVVDAVLEAQRLGASVRNYTEVTHAAQQGDLWQLELGDTLDAAARPVHVVARSVFNMGGIWIDRINARVEAGRIGRRITGTKGVHIVVRLPPECSRFGIATLNRLNEGLYCIPWRGLHYFGPTETLYDGDPDDIHPTEEDFEFLLGEANHLLPTLDIRRSDILYGWAGVRPLTYDPAQPMGARSRQLHDFGPEGAPNLFAMTAGPIMSHRSAGQLALTALGKGLAPSRPSQQPDFASRSVPRETGNSSREDKLSIMQRGVESEHAETIDDLLVRRSGLVWNDDPLGEDVDLAAEVLAKARSWSAQRKRQEAASAREAIAHRLHIDPPA